MDSGAPGVSDLAPARPAVRTRVQCTPYWFAVDPSYTPPRHLDKYITARRAGSTWSGANISVLFALLAPGGRQGHSVLYVQHLFTCVQWMSGDGLCPKCHQSPPPDHSAYRLIALRRHPEPSEMIKASPPTSPPPKMSSERPHNNLSVSNHCAVPPRSPAQNVIRAPPGSFCPCRIMAPCHGPAPLRRCDPQRFAGISPRVRRELMSSITSGRSVSSSIT